MTTFRPAACGGILGLGLAVGVLIGTAGPVYAITDVSLDIGEARRGAKAQVTVDVTAKKAIDIRRVVVSLRCMEVVQIPDYQLPEKKDDKGNIVEPSKTISVKKEEVLLREKEFTLLSGEQVPANTHEAFKGEIEIPEHIPPSYKGKYSTIKWEGKVWLDMKGLGDPDSGWREINVE